MLQQFSQPAPQNKLVYYSTPEPETKDPGSSFPNVSFFSISGILIVLGMLEVGLAMASYFLVGPLMTFYALTSIYAAGPGVVYIVTGSLGIAAVQTDLVHRKAGLKYGFMVMCIFCLFLAISAVAMQGSALSYLAAIVMHGISFGGNVVAFVVGIVGSSISCCCSPVNIV